MANILRANRRRRKKGLSSLSLATGKAILKLLQIMSRRQGMTIIIITHNSALTAMADRVIQVKNGSVISVRTNDFPAPVEEIEW